MISHARTQRLGAVLFTVLLAGAAHGDVPDRQAIDRITDASDIDRYEYLDPTHLLLTVDPQRRYRLTFEAPCNRLSFAGRIGISRSDDTIHAGFDYVVADGFRCRISAIEAL